SLQSTPRWCETSPRASRADGLLPRDDLTVAIGHERHAAVVRDHDGEAVRMGVDEAVGRAMPGADAFDRVRFAFTALGVLRAPHAVWRRQLGGDLGSESDEPEAFVEDDGAVDRREIRDDATP